VVAASNLLVSHLLSSLVILSLGVLVGLVVPVGGIVGGGSSILSGGGTISSGGGTISTLNSGRLSDAKEVNSEEGKDTEEDGLGDQVDGVAGTSEVQSALSLLGHVLGL